MVTPSAPLAQRVDVRIGGLPAQVTYAGMVPPGLCQITMVIPVGLIGDVPIVTEVGRAASPADVTIAVQP